MYCICTKYTKKLEIKKLLLACTYKQLYEWKTKQSERKKHILCFTFTYTKCHTAAASPPHFLSKQRMSASNFCSLSLIFLEIKRRKRHTPTRCWSVHNWSPPGCVLDTFHIIAFHGSVHLYIPKLELVSIKINIF